MELEAPTSGAASATWERPNLVMRVADINDYIPTSSARGLGDVRTDLVPLKLDVHPGPRGSTLTVRLPHEYFIRSDQDWDDTDIWEGKIYTLYVQRSGSTSRVSSVLFRGQKVGKACQFTKDQNGYTLHLSDWYPYGAAPIRMQQMMNMTVGTVCHIFEAGYYNTLEYNGIHRAVTPNYFDRHPFPQDENGNNIGRIDETLKSSTVFPGTLSFVGQSFREAFCELIELLGPNYLPYIWYDGNTPVLSAREKGARTKRLVVGAALDASATVNHIPNVQRLDGMISDEALYTQGVGVGGYTRTIDTVELTKDWTAAEETAVLADKSLTNTEQYRHVGRRYKAQKRFWPMNAIPHGESSTWSEQETPLILRRRDSTQQWERADISFEVLRTRSEGNENSSHERLGGRGMVIDRKYDITYQGGSHIHLWFADSQLWEYYTDAQQITRMGGTAVDPTQGTYDLQMQAVQIDDDPLLAYSDVKGTDPRHRMRALLNPEATKYTHTKHYTVDNDNSLTEVTEATSATTRNDTSILAAQVDAAITESSVPSVGMTAALWYLDFDWYLGDKIDLIDVEGNQPLGEVDWYVESISHDLQSNRTTLYLSNEYASIMARGVRAV